jgi:hypothetical protein
VTFEKLNLNNLYIHIILDKKRAPHSEFALSYRYMAAGGFLGLDRVRE